MPLLSCGNSPIPPNVSNNRRTHIIMNWQEFQRYLKNKVILVGLTFTDENGSPLDYYQTYGPVDELTDAGIIRIIKPEGIIFQVPYDGENFTVAEKGEYKLKSTGYIVKDPDFITIWEIATNTQDNSEIKRYGYIPPEE